MEYIKIPNRATDLTGQRFNRLTVLGAVEKNARNEIKWLCQCDCGGTTITTISMLRSGHTKSCGCWNIEKIKARFTRHGMSQRKVYGVWRAMIDRCTLPLNDNYENYGARGIHICDEWVRDFHAFYDYVSQLPKFDMDGMSLDRIDTDGNYEPGNMRWVTMKEQQRNRRNNHLITYQGKTQCCQAWADELGIGRSTIQYRLKKGWTVEAALTTPVLTPSENAARYLQGAKA